MALGVHKGQAEKWARERPPEVILGWVEHLRRNGKGLSNPAGFLVAKLREAEEPPAMNRPEGERRRYLGEGTEFEGFIEH